MALFKLKLKLDDTDLAELKDASKDGSVSKLRVKIEATHSGIVNKNNWFYTPQGMAAGTKSFVKPYPKPVLKNHDHYEDPLGRVEKARYVDYAIQNKWVSRIQDSKKNDDLVDAVKGFVGSSVFKAAAYKGMGHIELIASITDAGAIDKVLKGEYLTVSISGNTDKAVCSVCCNDLKDSEQAGKCNHYPGDVYDGEECFFIGGNMDFYEVSYVNVPADKFAISEVLKDSERQEKSVFLDACRFELMDFDRSGENKRGGQLKHKLQQVLSDKSIVDNILKQMGLGDHILAPESVTKLRKSSFLFSDESAVPVHDKAHVLAAYQVLDSIEDCEEEVEAARSVLDGKFKRMFNNISVEDALKLMSKQDVQDKAPAPASIDIDSIVSKIVDAIKSHVKIDDSYLFQRNQVLEREIEELESDYSKLNDQFRLSLVDQILSAEGRLSDSAYKERLQKRSFESLSDKLNDLRDSEKPEDPEENEDESGDVSDSKLVDKNLTVEDAAAQDEDESDSANSSKEEPPKRMSIGHFNDEYKSKVRTEGLAAAAKWIKQLRDENRYPEE